MESLGPQNKTPNFCYCFPENPATYLKAELPTSPSTLSPSWGCDPSGLEAPAILDFSLQQSSEGNIMGFGFKSPAQCLMQRNFPMKVGWIELSIQIFQILNEMKEDIKR